MGSTHRATGSSFTLLGIGLSGALTPITDFVDHAALGMARVIHHLRTAGLIVALAFHFT